VIGVMPSSHHKFTFSTGNKAKGKTKNARKGDGSDDTGKADLEEVKSGVAHETSIQELKNKLAEDHKDDAALDGGEAGLKSEPKEAKEDKDGSVDTAPQASKSSGKKSSKSQNDETEKDAVEEEKEKSENEEGV